MNYHWNWRIFLDLSPDAAGTYWESLVSGLGWTLATALSAWLMALLLGCLVGVLRTVPGRGLKRAGEAYVEFFRNIPLLVQMFLWFYVVPEFLPASVGTWLKQQPQTPFLTAVVALGLFTSARVADQVRAGILALPRGQRMAGLALGLTLPQTYRHVLLPSALRIVLPPLTSEFVGVVKNSAVALTVGLMELTARARSMQEFTFQVFEAFIAATLLYLAINLFIVTGMRWLERRVAVPGLIGAGGKEK